VIGACKLAVCASDTVLAVQASQQTALRCAMKVLR